MATFKRAIGRKIVKTSHLPLQADKDIKRMEKEIESLHDQLEFAHSEQLKGAAECVHHEKEIESLRKTIAIHESLKQVHDVAMNEYDHIVEERDEWKHRADLMWKYMNSGYTYPDALLYAKAFCLIEPEAKEADSWFEE